MVMNKEGADCLRVNLLTLLIGVSHFTEAAAIWMTGNINRILLWKC